MGIFGNSRKPMLSRELMAGQQSPMLSRELMAQQRDPLASLGGYDRNAAMMGQSGFAPMNQMQPAKKPGFFSKGGAFVDILGAFGDAFSGNGPVYAQQKAQRSRLMQEAQMAAQKRQQNREDFIWKQQNTKSTPYRFKANDGDIYEIGPDGKQNRLFDDPTPKVNWIQVKDPVTGAISIVPMGPNGRMDAAPQFAGWPDEEGGPASQAPGGFSGW